MLGALPTIGVPRDPRIPEGTPMSAGYVRGVPRLGVPAQLQTDASMGVTNPGYRPDDKGATSFPAAILVGSSFDLQLPKAIGAAIAREARSRGFNVLLAPGANLTSEVRNGRNYEYFSEDPLHTGLMAAGAIQGIQGERVIATLKHYAANNAETNRHWQNLIIDPVAARESELLGFQIAIERAEPGSMMCGYNMINGSYTCGHQFLLNDVLKNTWGYKGWVMADWGATKSWDFAMKGLDQDSGVQKSITLWGGDEVFPVQLRQAHADGQFPKARLSDMVQRMLRSMYAVGSDQMRIEPADLAAHNAIALEVARKGIVLLKNEDNVLPLAADRPLSMPP